MAIILHKPDQKSFLLGLGVGIILVKSVKEYEFNILSIIYE